MTHQPTIEASRRLLETNLNRLTHNLIKLEHEIKCLERERLHLEGRVKPAEIVSTIIKNIETVENMMDDGTMGFVLMTEDRMHLICQNKKRVWIDHPLSRDVAVFSSQGRAATMQRYWNDLNHEKPVSVILRREALAAYIAAQRETIDFFLTLTDIVESRR